MYPRSNHPRDTASVDLPLILGDVAHVSSFLFVIVNIFWKKSSAGWSGRMFILLCLIFIARLWKEMSSHGLGYFVLVDSIWITLSLMIVYLIFLRYSDTYEKRNDGFWIESIILFSGAGAFIVYEDVYSPDELMWLYSKFAESFSVLPQYYFIYHRAKKDLMMTYYIAILIYYRLFYCGHWISDWLVNDYVNYFSLYPGLIQLALYMAYFLIPKGKKRVPMEEPVAPHQERPKYLTSHSLLETPLLKRSATWSSSIYVIGNDSDSDYSTMSRSELNLTLSRANDEGRY